MYHRPANLVQLVQSDESKRRYEKQSKLIMLPVHLSFLKWNIEHVALWDVVFFISVCSIAVHFMSGGFHLGIKK